MADNSISEDQQSTENPSPAEGEETVVSPAPQAEERDPLLTRIAELEKAAETSRDQLLRKAAELENYKRRTEAEIGSIVRNANEQLILSLLPILDDFARSLKAAPDLGADDAFGRGIELIHGKLLKTLEKQGLRAFESSGKPFDVSFHDALLLVPRSDVPPHTVLEEVERGYMLNDRVLRHAKVLVSAPAETPPETAPEATPGEERADG